MRFHHNNSSGASVPRSQRQTTGRRNQKRIKITILGAAVIFAVAGFAGIAGFSPVKARDYDAEIRALQKQIDSYNEKASELSAQADTLQGKISELQNQQAAIQAQIDLSSAEKAQLEQQIAETESRIKAQSKALSENLKSQYYSSQTSALDILMNSDSVSDYVDRQTRQQAMSDQITDTVKQIQADKAELEKKREEVNELIKKQKLQKESLLASQQEQQELLAQTQGQEAKFQELTEKAKAEMANIRAQQQAALAALGGASATSGGNKNGTFYYRNKTAPQPCGAGGYPYCGVQDSYADPYALYNRECVSYAAWRINVGYGKYVAPFRGQGNAYLWPSSAVQFSGATIVDNPQPGDAAIIGKNVIGGVGHAMVVEKVLDDGWVLISQYNWEVDGRYSTMEISGTGITYLRFHN